MNTLSHKKLMMMLSAILFAGTLLIPWNTPISVEASKNTVALQLSPQQLPLIQTIFNDLHHRLTTATSTRETQHIFTDTILELYQHQLLPEGMSIDEAQHLLNIQDRSLPLIQRIMRNNQPQNTNGTIQNSFCSIAGNTSNTHVAKLAKRTALQLYYIIDFNTGNVLLNKAALALFVVFNEIAKLNQKILQQNGPHLGVSMYFGNYHYNPYPDWLSPAQGWISTDGMNGQQNITGSFWGQTMTGGWQPQVDWYMNYTWRGCLGFTGFIYYTGTDNVYFLGSALAVNIGPNRP